MLKEFEQKQNKSYNKHFRQIKYKTIDKLNRLINSKISHYNIQEPWFKNLSTKIIPKEV